MDAFWSTASSSIAKTSEPVSLSSRSKSLAASSWTVLSSESPSDRLTSTSKSVSSKMSFSPFLTDGGGVAESDACLGLAAGLAVDFALWVVSSASSESGASSIESAWPRPRPGPDLEVDSRVAGSRKVDAGELRVRRRHVGIACLGHRRRFELVAGIERTQLEIASRVGLEGIDQLARGIELEVAVRLEPPEPQPTTPASGSPEPMCRSSCRNP